jgi:hypothetical protein
MTPLEDEALCETAALRMIDFFDDVDDPIDLDIVRLDEICD